MSDPRSTNDVRTGLAVLAVLVGAATLIFFMDELRRALEEGPELIVETGKARLLPGSAVWVAGKPSGRVVAVRFQPPEGERAGSVVIRAVLQHEGAAAMRADAVARIQHGSLLGPMVLAIDPGSPARPPYDFSDTLRQVIPTFDEEAARAMADSLVAVLRRMRPMARGLDTLAERGPGTLAALAADAGLLRRLDADYRRLDGLLAAGEEGGGSLGALLRDTLLTRRLGRVRSRIRELSAEGSVPGGTEEARRLAEALAGLERRLTAIQSDLRRGEGSLGRFLHDDALARERAALRARIDTVMAELAADPLRWLRLELF